MPTPFMHLQMAEQMLADAAMDSDIRQFIVDQLPAFYLGNVAPDYQTISSAPREATHFYNLPPKPDHDACATMLRQYPTLTRTTEMPSAQAVFLAAYCCHLFLDLRWYHDILVPVFLGPGDWEDHRHRFIVHNTLLTYLDKQAHASLPEAAASTLAQAKPTSWLPFATNEDLVKWRDFLVSQMVPGATLFTVEIYAERVAMSPEEFSRHLDQGEWMEEHVFSRVDLESILTILASAVVESIQVASERLQVV